MLNIFIADDHEIVRRGLKQIVFDSSEMDVAGEAKTGEETVEIIREDGLYDVLVLDISMPGKSGVEVLKDIRSFNQSLPILMLSIHPESQYAIRTLKAGADGYLTKSSAPEELVKAIKKVASGGRYISPELAERLAGYATKDIEKQPHELLSDREFQVLKMMAAGKTLTQIGEDLGLSPKTVSTYKRRIVKKMQMDTNEELTRYAIHNDLV
jgi:DNA-binding NarL/FixJ family response regulator